MKYQNTQQTGKVSRRSFLTLGCVTMGLWVEGKIRHAQGADLLVERQIADHSGPLAPKVLSDLPVLKLPHVTSNGAKVPIVIEMTHPMEPEHYIKSVQVVNPRDPVPLKGMFHFSPANGKVYLAYQARMRDGFANVSVTAECNLHGQLSSSQSIYIPDGKGGCCNAEMPSLDHVSDEIRPPVIRIPELVKRGRIEPDEIIQVQLKMKHPNRTGLVLRNGTFTPVHEPFYLKDLEVLYGGERVSQFDMTSAFSDDPLITFPLRARHDGPLRIILANNKGQRFEATHEIRLSRSKGPSRPRQPE